MSEKKRYQNMISGYTLTEAGVKLGTLFPEETRLALDTAGIRPSGGTLINPRFNRLHVEQLAQILHGRSAADVSPRV